MLSRVRAHLIDINSNHCTNMSITYKTLKNLSLDRDSGMFPVKSLFDKSLPSKKINSSLIPCSNQETL